MLSVSSLYVAIRLFVVVLGFLGSKIWAERAQRQNYPPYPYPPPAYTPNLPPSPYAPNIRQPPWYPPSFCDGYQCPPYNLICKTREGVEVRTYRPSTWIFNKGSALSKITAINQAARNNREYIHGANQLRAQLPMTVPVLIQENIYSPYKAFDIKPYRVYFYVPENQQYSLPVPNNPEVMILRKPSLTYFVYPFNGYMMHLYFNARHFDQFKDILSRYRIPMSYNNDYFVASYDRPLKLLHRHNEIWVEVKDMADINRLCRGYV